MAKPISLYKLIGRSIRVLALKRKKVSVLTIAYHCGSWAKDSSWTINRSKWAIPLFNRTPPRDDNKWCPGGVFGHDVFQGGIGNMHVPGLRGDTLPRPIPAVPCFVHAATGIVTVSIRCFPTV